MDDSECSSDDMLERILQDPNSTPRAMQLEYLERITDNFSDERLLGEGGFGKVYKGELQNGKMIAVKKFQQLTDPDVQEMLFKNEVFPLMSLRHPNIVRFVGYCFETRRRIIEYNGKNILAELPKMFLCLEYLTKGSLDRLLSDGSSGLDWRTRYKIIKGVCRGLHYLHEECRSQTNNAFIIHLDLKPANILIDQNMVPKVADFGLSKLFYDKKTQTCSTTIQGTFGYMAPEYISERKITTKADIYSLGVVIIEIITGCKDDLLNLDIEQIINKWRNRSAEAPSAVDCEQIRRCLEIGKCCISSERNERPTTGEIIETLGLESIECSLNSEEGHIRKNTKRSCDMPPEDQEEGIILEIKEQMEKLREKSSEVRDKIKLAKGNGMVATKKIETWLARADTILSDAMAVLNWDTRIAATKLCQLRECLNDKPSDIAQPPSVLHMHVHDDLLPSQVLFVEQARQHIIEDAEGMIGIWGPVGVGKTLLLKAINNSFETGNSLIPRSSNKGDPPFDFVIYTTALEECSVQNIQSEIIQRLKMQDGTDSLTTQATRIFKFLQDKSFLVLLDGIHGNLNLAAVGLPPLGLQGQLKRKVVITTRSQSLCDQIRVNRAINVPSLKMDEALQLFRQSIGNDNLCSEPCIGALVKDLVEQLRALPSELIRIGSAMRGKGEPRQWQNIIAVTKELIHSKDQEASSLTEGIITKLKKCLQNLRGRSNDVIHEIELGKRKGKVATNQTNNWLASVDTNISVGMVICESEQNELNWNLSVIAAGMLHRLQECLSGQPRVVTVEALPPSVQQMPCSSMSTELQPSRVNLMFSYDNLRNDTLRECLLTCSLWPEDKEILMGDLIRCWIGVGLIDHSDIHGSYRKAHSLIGELTAACLLESYRATYHYGNYIFERRDFTHQVNTCVKMHDVIRDMAIWISRGRSDNNDKWVVRAGVGANLSIGTIPWSRAECISLMSNKINKLPPVRMTTCSTKLKNLYLKENILDERIFGAIQRFSELTYLDLSENTIEEIPEELCALVNLEHLDLSCNKWLRTVPISLRELTKLKFLYLGGTRIRWIPKEVISCLTELQVIDLTTINHAYIIYQELCTLTNLKAVDILIEGDYSYELLRKVAGIPIRDFILSGLEETKELCLAVDTLTGDIVGRTLNELHVERCSMEKIIVGDKLGRPFDALSVLGLRYLDNLTNIIMWKGASSQDLFPRLTYLDVYSCSKLQHLSWSSYLPCLEFLRVRICHAMEQICTDTANHCANRYKGQESSKIFPCLKYLILYVNYQLSSLCDSDVTFPSLEKLDIRGCPKLKQPPFTMQKFTTQVDNNTDR